MVSAWLAARHAQDQETIADNLALAFFPLWQIMRFNELDASSVAFVRAALPAVEQAFLQSQRVATVFNANARYAELTIDMPLLFDVPTVQRPSGVSASSFRMPELIVTNAPRQQRVPLQQFDSEDVAKTLLIESNYKTKSAMPGIEEEVMRAASVRTAGAAVRESLNGARGVTNNVMRVDRRIKGFARVTDSNPCPFCALLAARGAVYGKGAFYKSDPKYKAHPDAVREVPDKWTNIAKVHDNCRCMLRPVYRTESGFDAAATHYKDLWESDDMKAATKGPLSGPERRRVAINKFRELLKNNPFDGNQFDLNLMERDLQDRAMGLMDNGLAPNDPRVKWALDTRNDIRSAA